MDQLAKIISRIFFVGSFTLAGFAVWEKLANLLGRSLTFLAGYTPSRLLELVAIALLFVIALELRTIKHVMSSRDGSG